MTGAILAIELVREAGGARDLGGLGLVDADQRVDLDAGQRLGLLDREDLDLHAALDAGEREEGAVGPVQQHGEVELPRDLGAGRDHDAPYRVALDVQPENAAGQFLGLRRVVRDLDAAGLAATARLDLRLDDDRAAELLGCRSYFFWGVGDDAGQYRHRIGLKKVPGLILE